MRLRFVGFIDRRRAIVDRRRWRVRIGARYGQIEAIAAPRYGGERALPDDLAQRGDLYLQVVLLHDEPRPYGGEEIILRDQRAGTIHERDQQIERAHRCDRRTVGTRSLGRNSKRPKRRDGRATRARERCAGSDAE